MKKQYFCDEIRGQEGEDYIEEFSPHRFGSIRFEEDSELIFDADEEETELRNVMKR